MPEPACTCAGAICGNPRRRYTCLACERFVPWCFGAADGLGDLCDACACAVNESKRRARVRGDSGGPSRWTMPDGRRRPEGTISWAEYVEAWLKLSPEDRGPSPLETAESQPFTYRELLLFLEREPETWEPLHG